ncbi:MAG TPA: Smr/MutS family protein [Candidatus Binatia bacterium]|jgi:DNA-nicking Smr family endonuclease
MARRHDDEPQTPKLEADAFHTPFRDLARTLKKAGAARPTAPSRSAAPAKAKPGRAVAKPPATAREPAAAAEDDAASFARAMADVRRLDAARRIDAPPPALDVRRAPVSEDAEALAALSEFVAGSGAFDVSDSTEYVEGAVVGLDPRVLRRLRRGEFAYQAWVDLHGMSTAAARDVVARFVGDAFNAGHRAVLIVHGRGHNSKDNVPVLKERLKSWLARGQTGRIVLAFSSARPIDGGTGALYVLLRRKRGAREPITVLEGSRRE